MNRWPARAISNILGGKTGLLKLSVTISLQPLDGFFNFLGNIMLGGGLRKPIDCYAWRSARRLLPGLRAARPVFPFVQHKSRPLHLFSTNDTLKIYEIQLEGNPIFWVPRCQYF